MHSRARVQTQNQTLHTNTHNTYQEKEEVLIIWASHAAIPAKSSTSVRAATRLPDLPGANEERQRARARGRGRAREGEGERKRQGRARESERESKRERERL